MNHTGIIRAVAIIIVLAGGIIHWQIRRRKFKRRAISGIELFNSYESGLFIRFAEKIGRIAANILLWGGILLFLLTYIG
jgi:hypothetical protein